MCCGSLEYLLGYIWGRVPGEDPVAYLYRLVEGFVDPGERVESYVGVSEHFWREGLELVRRGRS